MYNNKQFHLISYLKLGTMQHYLFCIFANHHVSIFSFANFKMTVVIGKISSWIVSSDLVIVAFAGITVTATTPTETANNYIRQLGRLLAAAESRQPLFLTGDLWSPAPVGRLANGRDGNGKMEMVGAVVVGQPLAFVRIATVQNLASAF